MDPATQKGIDKEYVVDSGSDPESGELSAQPPADGLLHKKLQGRHMQMIAIGTLSQVYSSTELRGLITSHTQVVPLALVCSSAQARRLSKAVPAVW